MIVHIREKPMMAIEKDMDQRAGPSIPLCDYAGVRQMKQEASETRFLKTPSLKDGHVIMRLLIGYKIYKQTNQRMH